LEHGESASKLLNRGEESFDGMRMADVIGYLYRRALRTRMTSKWHLAMEKRSNKLGINFFLDEECRRIATAKAGGERRQA
jgi:hypothetical protein